MELGDQQSGLYIEKKLYTEFLSSVFRKKNLYTFTPNRQQTFDLRPNSLHSSLSPLALLQPGRPESIRRWRYRAAAAGELDRVRHRLLGRVVRAVQGQLWPRTDPEAGGAVGASFPGPDSRQGIYRRPVFRFFGFWFFNPYSCVCLCLLLFFFFNYSFLLVPADRPFGWNILFFFFFILRCLSPVRLFLRTKIASLI